MARSIWTGAISFGLVTVPVKMYSAVSRKTVRFHQLNGKTGVRIQQKRVDPSTGDEVAYEDIVKGYEFRRGEYVIMTDEDFERANSRRTKTIEIVSFTDAAGIAPYAYEKPYYLEPDKGADKPYALLRAALQQSGRVAVSTFVLRNREHLAAVYALGDVLVLNQLRFADEVRKPDGLNLPASDTVADREVKMALALIDQLTEEYDPSAYTDRYTQELETIIAAKVAGEAPEAVGGEAPKPTDVHDIMEMLKQSLERSRAEKRGASAAAPADDEPVKAPAAAKTKAPAKKAAPRTRKAAPADDEAPAKPRRSRAKPAS
jgi:DNA end-binding protein Ku